jgi:hypothetical protein
MKDCEETQLKVSHQHSSLLLVYWTKDYETYWGSGDEMNIQYFSPKNCRHETTWEAWTWSWSDIHKAWDWRLKCTDPEWNPTTGYCQHGSNFCLVIRGNGVHSTLFNSSRISWRLSHNIGPSLQRHGGSLHTISALFSSLFAIRFLALAEPFRGFLRERKHL